MPCTSCLSRNQAEFTTEMNIHFAGGLKTIDIPSVFVFPKILVCLDCGFSRFTLSETKLGVLREGIAPSAAA